MIPNSPKVLDVCLELMRSEGNLEDLLGLVDGRDLFTSTGDHWFIMHRNCIGNSDVIFPALTDYWVAVKTPALSGVYCVCHEVLVGMVVNLMLSEQKKGGKNASVAEEFLRLAKCQSHQQ